MKRKTNLSEELYKMRKLMGYDPKKDVENMTTYDRLIEETLVKKTLLKEQTESDDKYGVYNFGAAFPDNYVDPKKETYEPIIKKMIEDYKKALASGKKLIDINMAVESSASSRRASNRYTEPQPPKHDYGGLLKKYAPKGWVVANDENEKIIIPDGNKFLAEKRGEVLKNIIIQSLNAAGIKITSNMVTVEWKVSDSPDPKEQYVIAKVKGLLRSDIPPPPPPPEKKYRYSIIVDWYKIGGGQTPYILIGTTSNSVKQKDSKYQFLWNAGLKNGPDGSSWELGKNFIDSVKSSDDSVKIAGYNFRPNGYNGNERYFFKAFGSIENYKSSKGNIFYFEDKDVWMKEVIKMNNITPRTDKINFQGNDNKNKFSEVIFSKGNYGDDFGQADFSGGYVEFTAENNFYLLKPSVGEAKKIKGANGYFYGEPVKITGYKAGGGRSGEATQPETPKPRVD